MWKHRARGAPHFGLCITFHEALTLISACCLSLGADSVAQEVVDHRRSSKRASSQKSTLKSLATRMADDGTHPLAVLVRPEAKRSTMLCARRAHPAHFRRQPPSPTHCEAGSLPPVACRDKNVPAIVGGDNEVGISANSLGNARQFAREVHVSPHHLSGPVADEEGAPATTWAQLLCVLLLRAQTHRIPKSSHRTCVVRHTCLCSAAHRRGQRQEEEGAFR